MNLRKHSNLGPYCFHLSQSAFMQKAIVVNDEEFDRIWK